MNWAVLSHVLLVYKTVGGDDCTASLAYNKGAYRKGGATFDGRWHSKEAKAILGNPVKGAKMFHNWNACSQQNGVSGSGSIAHIVDVGAINTYQGCF